MPPKVHHDGNISAEGHFSVGNTAFQVSGTANFDIEEGNTALQVSGTANGTKIDGEKFSQRIQILISHENELRNNRMSWFGTLEGFLWLSFAYLLTTDDSCKMVNGRYSTSRNDCVFLRNFGVVLC